MKITPLNTPGSWNISRVNKTFAVQSESGNICNSSNTLDKNSEKQNITEEDVAKTLITPSQELLLGLQSLLNNINGERLIRLRKAVDSLM